MRSFSEIEIQWLVIIAFTNFSGVEETENIWCINKLKTSFSNLVGVVWAVPELFKKTFPLKAIFNR